MSQRVAGERARWSAAVLMVASIGAGSVIVRIWPVDTVTPVLASRQIQLYQAPMAPMPVMAAAAVRPSDKPRQIPRPLRLSADVAAPAQPESAVAVVAPPLALDAAPPAAAAADIAVVPAVVDAMEPADVRAAIGTPLENPEGVATSAEGVTPAAAPSRGIADVPAVAVTRAVTIAGRGIMTGLKATTAILRAPF